MAAHRKLDRRRDDLCARGLRKCACGSETLYVRVRGAVDGMLTLRASKVVVFVRKHSLMCRGDHWCRG